MTRAPRLPLKLLPGVQTIRSGPSSFALRHPQTGQVWELGGDERFLLHLLEKQNTFGEVRESFEQQFHRGLKQSRLLEFVEQLRRQDLLDGPDAKTPQPVVAETVSRATNGSAILLTSADRKGILNFCFDVLAVFFGWLVHPAWAVLYLPLAIAAIASVLGNWNRFLTDELDWWRQYPFLLFFCGMFLQTILLFNIPRVLFLAMACRRLGGRVESFGIKLWESVVPAAYVNLGDSLAFVDDSRRWKLYWTDFWFQVGLGSMYVLLWVIAHPGFSGGRFFLMMFIPWMAAMFIQCNIFFDSAAYRALCGVTGEWQLRERALSSTRAWLLGRTAPESLPGAQRFWFRIYGLGYYLFRCVFTPAMLLLLGFWLINAFGGTGAAAFLLIVLWWFSKPMWRAFHCGIDGLLSCIGVVSGDTRMTETRKLFTFRHGGHHWLRWTMALLILGGVAAAGFIPYSHEIAGECRLVPIEQRAVRTQISDEVVSIDVVEGDQVTEGQLLCTLSAREANHDVAAASAALDKAQAELELLQQGYRVEDIKIAEQKIIEAHANVTFYETEVKRRQSIREKGATTDRNLEQAQKELDKARTELVSAQENLHKQQAGYRPEAIRSLQADVNAKKADLKHAQEMLALTKISSPISGKIVSAYMPERHGQNAKAGTIVAVVQDMSKLLVEIAADDSAVAQVKPGMRVKVRLASDDGEFRMATVKRLAPVVEVDSKYGVNPLASDETEKYAEQNANSRYRSSGSHVRVYAELEDSTENMTDGMTGYARIVVDENNLLWQSVARPIVKFVRTEVWSWLP